METAEVQAERKCKTRREIKAPEWDVWLGQSSVGTVLTTSPLPPMSKAEPLGSQSFLVPLHLPEVTTQASIAHTHSAASQGANKSISACTMLWVPWENLCALQPLQPCVAM